MSELNSFIPSEFRPEIKGGTLELSNVSKFKLSKQPSNSLIPIEVNAICFGPKTDRVLMNLEHAVVENDDVIFMYYEDIHNSWTFQSNNNEQYFLCKKNKSEEYKVTAKTLYIRGCYLTTKDKHWKILGYFFNFVEMWNGQVLCSPSKQITNESKLFQLNNSLSASSIKCNNISIGKSFVIKGEQSFNKLDPTKKYIVKSLSGVRSIVVDNNSFSSWQKTNLNSLPVLFQEKVEGNDVRVHVIKNKAFGKTFPSTESVDYRYDESFFKMTTINNLNEDLKDFVINVSRHEENMLMGVDFIQSDNKYTVLEANPSPGWSAYHECNGIDNDVFVTTLIKVLIND